MSWINWCRLCGHDEMISKIDPEIIEAIKMLNSQIKTEDLRICTGCSNYLSEVYQFIEKTRLIHNMFLELESVELMKSQESADPIIQQQEIAIDYNKLTNDVRTRYGLETLDNKEILDSFLESNITSSALAIKIESEMDLEIGADNLSEDEFIEDNSEDISDVSSNIEELSDSKLSIKYDQLSEDEIKSSESEKSFSKKKRKKYRKSDEEKLFDFVCHMCRQEFPKMCQLSSHCRRIHDCLPQVMCYCGKALGTWKRLLIHKRKHFPEKFDYECKECKMVYKLKASFLNHMRKRHGPDAKKFVCHQCARCFKDSRLLMSHEKTHLPDELKLIYPCDICQKKFVNKNSLKSHVTSVHEMASLYTCEQCGKSFSTKSNLKSHLYSHSNEKNVQCDTCSARFKNMDSLRKHKKTHLEKSHECSLCGNRYRNRNNLKAHMVCHSEAKPFKCTYCPNEYKRSKDLKCHMNLHSGERPYQCQFCARTFVNGSNCRKHKLKDHPDELAAFESVYGKGKTAVFALHCVKQ